LVPFSARARAHRIEAYDYPAHALDRMKLFKIEVTTKRFRVLDIVVHASSTDEARRHVASKFTGCKLSTPRELPDGPKHFVVADVDAFVADLDA